MRESIGATWILGIVIMFITVFSGYLAFSINYSTAFSVKDGIVERIEKNNGFNNDTIKDINEFLNTIGYNSKGKCTRLAQDGNLDNTVGLLYGETSATQAQSDVSYNYCVRKIYNAQTTISDGPAGTMTSAYYRVVVFFSLSIPIINELTNFSVDGETRYINYPVDAECFRD